MFAAGFDHASQDASTSMIASTIGNISATSMHVVADWLLLKQYGQSNLNSRFVTLPSVSFEVKFFVYMDFTMPL